MILGHFWCCTWLWLIHHINSTSARVSPTNTPPQSIISKRIYFISICLEILRLSLIWRDLAIYTTNIPCYKTNFPFYKTKLRIMILTMHILKLIGYHNINIHILILLYYKILVFHFNLNTNFCIKLTSVLF